MKRAIAAAAITLLLACSPSGDDADAGDTMSLATVDTLKPATDTGAIGTTTASVPAPGTTQSKMTAATQSKTGTKAAPVDTTNLGRDQAIPINTKDPKVRLPTVDTTKRPPGGE